MRRSALIFGILAVSIAACSNDTTTRRVTQTTTTQTVPKPAERSVTIYEPQTKSETIILQPKPEVQTQSHTTYRVETHEE